MTSPTHVTFAEFLYLLLLTTTGVSLNPANAVLVALASLLPDIDTGSSTIGKILPAISGRIERRFGHRTLTHSALCIVCLALGLVPIATLNVDWYACVLCGYASHPFLDTMTVHGVKLFYPFSPFKCVFPLEVNNPHRYRLQTGGKTDRMLAILFLLCCLPTFLIAYQGYERFIRTTQQNIEAAVRDYNEFSKSRLVFADIVAYHSLTKTPLEGKVEVVAALDVQTMIFKGFDGHLHTVGKIFQADFVAERIICLPADTVSVKVLEIDMSNQFFSQIANYLDTAMEQFLFGEFSTTEAVSLPQNAQLFNTVTGGGKSIKLNYARYGDICEFGLDRAFVSNGMLILKTVSVVGRDRPEDPSLGRALQPDNIVQVTASLTEKEAIVFLKDRGDTVSEKDLLARRGSAQLFHQQMVLNDEQSALLGSELAMKLADLDQRIAAADRNVRVDSAEERHYRELAKMGFTATPVSSDIEVRAQKSRRLLSQLLSLKTASSLKTAHRIRMLEVANAKLRTRLLAEEQQSAILSPLRGVIVERRQVFNGTKRIITMFIKRLR